MFVFLCIKSQVDYCVHVKGAIPWLLTLHFGPNLNHSVSFVHSGCIIPRRYSEKNKKFTITSNLVSATFIPGPVLGRTNYFRNLLYVRYIRENSV